MNSFAENYERTNGQRTGKSMYHSPTSKVKWVSLWVGEWVSLRERRRKNSPATHLTQIEPQDLLLVMPFLIHCPLSRAHKKFQAFDHNHVLDIMTVDQDMRYQRQWMHCDREDSQIPHSGPFLGMFGPVLVTHFFSENQASSLFFVYSEIPSCQKSKKSNDRKYENVALPRDRRTDRTELVTKDLPAIRWVQQVS